MACRFLLEILTEEMPAVILPSLRDQLLKGLKAILEEETLTWDSLQAFATPRRLSLLATGLPEKTPDKEEIDLGPPWEKAFDEEGKLTSVGEGFARAKGVNPDEIIRVEKEKGVYCGIPKVEPGKPIEKVLEAHLPSMILKLRYPKAMRWGEKGGPFIRPIHRIVALLDDHVLPIGLFGVSAGKETLGHRQKGLPTIVLSSEGYMKALREQMIMVDPEERKEAFRQKIQEICEKHGGKLLEDEALLDYWTYSVEYPGVIVCPLPASARKLPLEVVEEALKTHQKAMLMVTDSGEVGDYFLALMDREDDPSGLIQVGQTWIAQARLEDAQFFFQKDKETPLLERIKALSLIVFHEKVGNYLQKIGRIQELTEFLCHQLHLESLIPQGLQAAKLCKSDLTTLMVREFPNLEGKMGGIYARLEGMDAPVWKAIYQHRLPREPGDQLPEFPLPAILAIADRMDSIASLMAAGERVTGSRDPYGLRRLGNTLMEILLGHGLDVDVDLLLTKALSLLETPIPGAVQSFSEIRQFLEERLRSRFLSRGFPEDSIRAVLDIRSHHPADALKRLDAIEQFRSKKDFINFILSFKRIRNILTDEAGEGPNPELFQQPEEHGLYQDFIQVKSFYLQALKDQRYEEALSVMETLSNSLSHFFDKVLVMEEDKDLRRNRLSLLKTIYREFLKIAQFSLLQVSTDEYK